MNNEYILKIAYDLKQWCLDTECECCPLSNSVCINIHNVSVPATWNIEKEKGD